MKITYNDFSYKLLPAFIFPFCLMSNIINRNYLGIGIVIIGSFIYIIIGRNRYLKD